jgi:hypothetical protein
VTLTTKLFGIITFCVFAVLLELPAHVNVLISGHTQQQIQQQHVPVPHVEDAAASSNGSSMPATAEALATSTDQQGVNSQRQEPADQQQQQQQQLVLASRSVLVRLLQRCSDSIVRQQVYCAGLLPRLAEAAALLDELARWAVLQLHGRIYTFENRSYNPCNSLAQAIFI